MRRRSRFSFFLGGQRAGRGAREFNRSRASSSFGARTVFGAARAPRENAPPAEPPHRRARLLLLLRHPPARQRALLVCFGIVESVIELLCEDDDKDDDEGGGGGAAAAAAAAGPRLIDAPARDLLHLQQSLHHVFRTVLQVTHAKFPSFRSRFMAARPLVSCPLSGGRPRVFMPVFCRGRAPFQWRKAARSMTGRR